MIENSRGVHNSRPENPDSAALNPGYRLSAHRAPTKTEKDFSLALEMGTVFFRSVV
jgi:hypothetical protein